MTISSRFGKLATLTLLAASMTFARAQDSTIPVPDNLITEGVPAIPQSIVDSVGRYSEFRSANFNSWDPVKRRMLITTRFGDTNQVHQVAMPGGARTQMTFFPDNIQRAFYGPNTDDWFIFHKDVGGNEFFQFYRYDTATGESTLLTDGKSRNTDGLLSNDGKWLIYMSTRRTGNDSDLYMVDVNDPKTDHMVTQLQGGGWAATDITDDGKTILLENSVSVNEAHLYLVDVESGKMQPLTPTTGDKIAYGAAFFGPDHKTVYVNDDEGTEFSQLRKMDIATGKSVNLTADIPWDVDAMTITHDRQKIAFTTNENGMGVVYVLDTRTDKYKKQDNIPTGTIGGLSWRNNGPELGFTINSAKANVDAYSYDTSAGSLTRWTTSEAGGLNTATFQDAKLIKWKSFDGKEISGWLRMPPADKFTGPRPVMIEIHGGPEDEARPTFYGRYNYYINEMGIATISPNVRGSTGFGKTFSKLDNGVLREDTYKDIGALLDWIKANPALDSSKVVVTGGSYGGHMTYALSYYYADRIACSIPIVGMTNLVTFLENTSGYRRDLRRVEYGDERDPATRKVLEDIAPMNHASQITKPIFIIAGQNDPRVPISEATQFEGKIKGSNLNTWFLVAKDEGHGFVKKKNRDFQMYATVLFLRKFLLGQ